MKKPYSIFKTLPLNNVSMFEILRSATDVVVTDHNLKPDWIPSPAEYTEFHIKRNKETLLVFIGESWAYGETVRRIATAIRRYNFEDQLAYTVGSRLAVMLDSDLYQYAVPGNCNFYMFKELKRILKYTSTLGYKKIYVCMQMTEPGREKSILTEIEEQGNPVSSIIGPTKKMTFNTWLEKYDDAFFDWYEGIISQYTNLDCILWKNFCKINSKNTDRTFKIIDKTWIQYSANCLGKQIAAPAFYAVGWLDNIMKDYHTLSFDKKTILSEIDIIEQSNAFIKANALHSNHPNEFGHLLWAQYLARKSGWNNDL